MCYYGPDWDDEPEAEDRYECESCERLSGKVKTLEEDVKCDRIREGMYQKQLAEIADCLQRGDAATALRLAQGDCPF
jgi:hypothetical protein